MITTSDIAIEVIPHNGHLILTAFYGDEMIKRTYIGYTPNEAKIKFIEDYENLF